MIKKLYTTLIVSSIFMLSLAQGKNDTTKNHNEEQRKVFNYVVDSFPRFNGQRGEIGFRGHIVQHLNYPDSAEALGLEGIVYVKFTIDEEGNLTKAEVVKGVHEILDQEALRIVNLSPKWQPGYANGTPIPVQFTFPIRFISYESYLKSGRKHKKKKDKKKKK